MFLFVYLSIFIIPSNHKSFTSPLMDEISRINKKIIVRLKKFNHSTIMQFNILPTYQGLVALSPLNYRTATIYSSYQHYPFSLNRL
jgi:hypothetical protein